LQAECIAEALGQAGLTLDDVDGFCTASGDWAEGGAYSDVLDVADYLGIRPTYYDSTDVGGGSCIGHAGHAVSAIRAGRANVVVLSYAGCPRWWTIPEGFKDGVTFPAGPGQFEIPYAPTIIASMGMQAQRHMHEYGTTPEQLARIAVEIRSNASKNPQARYRDPLTVDDVLSSPVIASPLHKFDCCVITDGAGAVVLTSEARALDGGKPPVWILGFGEAMGELSRSGVADRSETMRTAANTAYAEAGLAPSDIDVAQLYDAFTSTVLFQLEAMGFCGEGEAGPFVESGAIGSGGAIPVNTDGGGLSSNHPGRRGMFALIEGVRQLRNEGPGVQVPDCRTALVTGLGVSAAMTMILGVG
jgi:acetyl-CoA acetyltransferase